MKFQFGFIATPLPEKDINPDMKNTITGKDLGVIYFLGGIQINTNASITHPPAKIAGGI